MNKENYKRVQEIMNKLHWIDWEIEHLEYGKEQRNGRISLEFPGRTVPPIVLLDNENSFDRIEAWINEAIEERREERLQLEEELEQL